VQLMAVLGLVARWSGDPSTAEEWFETAERRASELGWRGPSIRWWTADYAEMLLEAGRIDDAARPPDAVSDLRLPHYASVVRRGFERLFLTSD
jgi:hypothetical protein